MSGTIQLLIALLLTQNIVAQTSALADHVPALGPTATSGPREHRVLATRSNGHAPLPRHHKAVPQLRLHGSILVMDDRMDDVELVVIVENGECQGATIRRNGRFEVLLPAGVKARLIFQKTGHEAKEIIVDGTALPRMHTGLKQRNVQFDVVLVPEAAAEGLAGHSPVGSILFRKGTGSLQVQHHAGSVMDARLGRRGR
jgi:hypothetical protein